MYKEILININLERVIMDIEGSSEMNIFINGYGTNGFRRAINNHSY